ncbi:MAG: hypothetical protein IT257_09605 [Chitinophagaceae bacterium]|nr:hypothetical protein [Chitinophagaceae bacterium]
MYKLLLIILFCMPGTIVMAQLNPRQVIAQDWLAHGRKADSEHFYITKIDTNNFKTLLSGSDKLAIQFWQPWCSGITDLMPKVNALKRKLEAEGYRFLLISDHQTGMDYLKLRDGKMGMIVYYFSKYNIDFPTYIIGEGESLTTYQKLVSDFLKTKANKDHYCMIFSQRKLLFYGYTYQFYKKFLHER